MMNKLLNEWAQKRGYRVACASPQHLEYIKARMEDQQKTGAIDPDFFRQWLMEFQYPDESKIREFKSLVLIAVPRPAHILTFQLHDRAISTILPPTYVNYRPLFESVKKDFISKVAGEDSMVMLLTVPLKSLAARVGFIQYGRNNIGYVAGLGSYIQLMCLATSLPIEFDHGTENELKNDDQQMLEQCHRCKKCIDACTVKAIPEERFLLRAEQCYTAFSESINPFPVGLASPSPSCLIGCLKCQLACPVNRKLLQYEKIPFTITTEETQAILDDSLSASSSLQDSITNKFATLNLTESISLFIRNFRHGAGFFSRG